MKTLLLRQVRLLAAPALLIAGMALLVLLVAGAVDERWRPYRLSPGDLAFGLIAVVAPWLLAVAAVAPDGESGGLSFLRTLPVGPTRQLLLRALVALGWSVVVVAPFYATTRLPDRELEAVLLLSALAFGAGLAAACVVRQSLGAFVVAPLLVGALLGLHHELAELLRAPGAHVDTVRVLAVPALLLAGWAAFRDPARDARGPVLRGAAVLGAALLLACGATTAGWARARLSPPITTRWSQAEGVVLRHEMDYTEGRGPLPLVRTWVFAPGALVPGASLDDATRSALQLDGYASLVSAQGERAVLAVGARWMLVDVRAKQVLAQGALDEVTSSAVELADDRQLSVSDRHLVVGWLGDEPWAARRDRTVRSLVDDRTLARLADDAVVEGWGGRRLVVRSALGLELLDLRTGAVERLAGPGERHSAVLSQHGRLLARWPGEGPLEVQDLETGARVVVHETAAFETATLLCSPCERVVIVQRPFRYRQLPEKQQSYVVDLVRGDVRRVAWWFYASCWSPGGRRVADRSAWVDLDDAQLTTRRLEELDDDEAWLGFDGDDALLEIVPDEDRVERVPLAR